MSPAETPYTLPYMILGYAAAALIMVALVAYLVLKARRLRAEIEMLRTLEAEHAAAETSSEAAEAPASQGT